MSPHVDILDQPEHLGRSFVGSLVFHAGLAFVIGGVTWASRGSGITLGSPGGGRMGAVIVSPVNIPLPNRGGETNPVANDTKSQLPTPPPEKKAPKSTPKAPDPNAIPLPSKNATKKPSWWIADKPDKFREKQKFEPNQLYSQSGQRLSSPNMQLQGGGGVGLSGSNSPFGSQFGAYGDLIISQVARKWNKPGADTRNTTPRVIVSFTLHRDGSVSDVKISQRSGNQALDYSGQRAIFDAAPFPPFPPGLNKSEIGIDFVFELGR
jgi:periplasmic protein TonB